MRTPPHAEGQVISTGVSTGVLRKPVFLRIFKVLCQILCFLLEKTCFLSFSKQNHAESSRNFVKNSVLDPKTAKLNQKSWFGHVRTCQDLSKRTSTYCKPTEILLICVITPFLLFISNFIIFIKPYVLFNKSIFFYKSCVLLSN